MLISVVIPFYNELNLIARAVTSVFEQNISSSSGVCFEVIISNDGPLGNAEIMAVIPTENISETHIIKNAYLKGPGGARNTGLDTSKGEYVAFLDADDFWLKDKIRVQLDLLLKGKNFVCSGYEFEGSNIVIKPAVEIKKPLDVFLKLGIGTSTVIVSRELVGEDRFRDIRFCQDVDFWYRLAVKKSFRYAASEKKLVVYSRGGSTQNKFVQAKFFWRVLRMNAVPSAMVCMVLIKYALRGIYNHYLKRGA